jgi:AbrB family looped-hinge helix DNA binding protein
VKKEQQKIKMSSKFQIVIPKEARQRVHLKAGDKLVIEGMGDKIVLWKQPKDYTEHMAGLHKNIWQNENIDKYLEDIRSGWSKR